MMTAPRLVVAVGMLLAAMLLYAAVLASGVIARDRELPRATRMLRLAVVWLVPLLGPILALRLASEESPALMPSRTWLWPLQGLLADKPGKYEGEDGTDTVAEAGRVLPGLGPNFIPFEGPSAGESWTDSTHL